MSHPNICGLKAYFYSQGDGKVWCMDAYLQHCLLCIVERWGIPQLGLGICTGNGVPGVPSLCKNQATNSSPSRQDLYVPTFPFSSLFSCTRYMPSWYQAAELIGEPSDRCAQTLWFRKASNEYHMQKGTWSDMWDIWCDDLVQRFLSLANRTCRTSVHVITGHLNWFLAPQLTQHKLIFGQQAAWWESCY